MSDAPRRTPRRWMPIVLGLSLAVNFAALAAVGGALWRSQGREGHADRRPPYLRALDQEDRQEIRDTLRALPRGGRLDAARVLDVLRADPFDREQAEAVLRAERDASLARHDAVRAVWLDRIAAMTSEQRQAYAQRLNSMIDARRAGR